MSSPLLAALVGPEGAAALAAAAARLPGIDAAMTPRALYSWIGIAATTGYDGEVPGSGGHLSLAKSEAGGFNGRIDFANVEYDFADSSLLHVSAVIASLAGLTKSADISDDHLYRLGRTVDLLVRAHTATEARLAKAEAESGLRFEYERDVSGDDGTITVYAIDRDDKEIGRVSVTPGSEPEFECDDENIKSKLMDVVSHLMPSLEKGDKDGAESPGPAHKPTAAAGAIPPVPPTATQDAQPPRTPSKNPGQHKPPVPTLKIPKIAGLKLSEKQLRSLCPVCDGSHMSGDEFTGCDCVSDLAPFAELAKSGDSFSIRFGAQWSEDAVLCLIDSVTRGAR